MIDATHQALQAAAWAMTSLEPANLGGALSWTWSLPPML